MKKILFVDDEQKVLDGLQRMLRPLRNEWTMTFAPSGAEALAILAQTSYDVIVTDMRMPGMDGADLLAEVMKRQPHILRIVLSGQSDPDLILKAVGTAHQYLSKPCDAETLKAIITRSFHLRHLLAKPSLQKLVSRITSLPSIPSLYMELVEALRSPDTSVQKVGQIIAKDIAMTAKVLQLVNSAFFGLRRHIANPTEAAVYLGVDTLKALVLSTKVFSQFSTVGLSRFSIEGLWKHSLAVGTFGQRLAKFENAPKKVIDDTLMAGLLHDIGKLVLAVNEPKQFDESVHMAQTKGIRQEEAESAIFGATHAEVGTYLLWLWGLPDSITEAAAFHHDPSRCTAQTFGPLTAVHVANVWNQEAQPSSQRRAAVELDLGYLAKLGLSDHIPKWQAIFQEAA